MVGERETAGQQSVAASGRALAYLRSENTTEPTQRCLQQTSRRSRSVVAE